MDGAGIAATFDIRRDVLRFDHALPVLQAALLLPRSHAKRPNRPTGNRGAVFCACARSLCCTHRSDGWPAARSAIAFAAGLRAAQMLAGGGGIKVGGSFDPCGSGGGFELQVLTTGEFCVTYRCALLNKMIAYMLSQ
jgi:hypothetical protein